MADRTTPLKFQRRLRGDLLARVARNPKGARVMWRGVAYMYVRCPGCRQWYWRIYYTAAGLDVLLRKAPRHSYCSEACSNLRQAELRNARQRRWMRKNPGYTPPHRRR